MNNHFEFKTISSQKELPKKSTSWSRIESWNTVTKDCTKWRTNIYPNYRILCFCGIHVPVKDHWTKGLLWLGNTKNHIIRIISATDWNRNLWRITQEYDKKNVLLIAQIQWPKTLQLATFKGMVSRWEAHITGIEGVMIIYHLMASFSHLIKNRFPRTPKSCENKRQSSK